MLYFSFMLSIMLFPQNSVSNPPPPIYPPRTPVYFPFPYSLYTRFVLYRTTPLILFIFVVAWCGADRVGGVRGGGGRGALGGAILA